MRRRRGLWLLRCLGASLPGPLGILVSVWLHDSPVRHFAVVERGVLYRSGQPDEAGRRRLRDHYGIRTVIDLG